MCSQVHVLLDGQSLCETVLDSTHGETIVLLTVQEGTTISSCYPVMMSDTRVFILTPQHSVNTEVGFNLLTSCLMLVHLSGQRPD